MLLTCLVSVCYCSAINPILYNAMSVKFRRAFNRALTCGKSRQFYTSRWPNYCRTNTSYATTTGTASTTMLPTSTTLTYNLAGLGGMSGNKRGGGSPLCPTTASSSPSQNIRLSHLSLSTPSRLDIPAVLSPQTSKKSNYSSYSNAVSVIVDSDAIHSCHEDDITQL